MRTHSEVNFEKRGKLTDHQTCPVTGECQCVCHHCKPSKRLFLLSVFFFLLFLPTLSLATDAPYTFHRFELDPFLTPVDLNDKRDILYNLNLGATQETLIVPTKINKRGKVKPPTRFGCSDVPFFGTIGESINKKADIVGSCVVDGKEVGFVRFKNGFHFLLDVPGSTDTQARGVSDNGKIAGQFISPLDPNRGGTLGYRFHCWTFDAESQQFTVIDFPLPSTFVDCSAINNRGQLVVRWIEVDNDNNTLRAGWAFYDNGNWSFPLALDTPQSSLFIADINREGTAIVERFGVGEGLFLFDDNNLFAIDTPDDWVGISVGGMNNLEEFIGVARKQIGTDFFGQPIFERFGFLALPATPALAKVAKK